MEYSGDLPKLCGSNGGSNLKLIIAIVLIIAVVVGVYYAYKTIKKDENFEGEENDGYLARRTLLQPLPYRCPYNTY